jgi:hypothetical protein
VAEVVRTEHIFPSLTHGSVYSLIAATARSLAETHNWEALAQYQFPLALVSDLRNGVRVHPDIVRVRRCVCECRVRVLCVVADACAV